MLHFPLYHYNFQLKTDQTQDNNKTFHHSLLVVHPTSKDTNKVLNDDTFSNLFYYFQLDLGWVWGQDATKMQATRPKRQRIRRAQALPVSPHVGPLSSDMDTVDSGLGTADGDMMFGAPYSSELPTSADITSNTQTSFMLSDVCKKSFCSFYIFFPGLFLIIYCFLIIWLYLVLLIRLQ